MMKLSIVTINYNNAEGVERTLNSVLNQSYEKIEHIIVDGGSSDGSVDVIKRYVQKVESGKWKVESVIWSSEKDKGIYDGMNKGVKKATGDFVWILNSGDCAAAPDVVERMMGILSEAESGKWKVESGIDILLGNIIHVYPGRKVVGGKRKVERGKPQLREIGSSMLTFYSGTIPHDAAFVRRELFEKFGYFDEKMKICADWKLYLDMIALGGVQPWYVNIDVVLFDMSGVSNTNNKLRLAERREYLEQVLPAAVLKDYDAYARPIGQYERLRKHHIWSLVTFIERVLFKLEKWGVLR